MLDDTKMDHSAYTSESVVMWSVYKTVEVPWPSHLIAKVANRHLAISARSRARKACNRRQHLGQNLMTNWITWLTWGARIGHQAPIILVSESKFWQKKSRQRDVSRSWYFRCSSYTWSVNKSNQSINNFIFICNSKKLAKRLWGLLISFRPRRLRRSTSDQVSIIKRARGSHPTSLANLFQLCIRRCCYASAIASLHNEDLALWPIASRLTK